VVGCLWGAARLRGSFTLLFTLESSWRQSTRLFQTRCHDIQSKEKNESMNLWMTERWTKLRVEEAEEVEELVVGDDDDTDDYPRKRMIVASFETLLLFAQATPYYLKCVGIFLFLSPIAITHSTTCYFYEYKGERCHHHKATQERAFKVALMPLVGVFGVSLATYRYGEKFGVIDREDLGPNMKSFRVDCKKFASSLAQEGILRPLAILK